MVSPLPQHTQVVLYDSSSSGFEEGDVEVGDDSKLSAAQLQTRKEKNSRCLLGALRSLILEKDPQLSVRCVLNNHTIIYMHIDFLHKRETKYTDKSIQRCEDTNMHGYVHARVPSYAYTYTYTNCACLQIQGVDRGLQ